MSRRLQLLALLEVSERRLLVACRRADVDAACLREIVRRRFPLSAFRFSP